MLNLDGMCPLVALYMTSEIHSESMQRDRAQTEQRLIEAVGLMIAEEGYDKIGINRVAARAGVNKILIYRYFGGLQGLIDAYLQHLQLNLTSSAIDMERLHNATLEEIFEYCADYFIDEYRRFRRDTRAQELLKAALLSKDYPANVFAEREQHLGAIIKQISDLIQAPYGLAFATFMHSAMITLTVFKQQHKKPFGLDLDDDAAWGQIEAVIRHIFRGSYAFMKKQLPDLTTMPHLTESDLSSTDGNPA